MWEKAYHTSSDHRLIQRLRNVAFGFIVFVLLKGALALWQGKGLAETIKIGIAGVIVGLIVYLALLSRRSKP